VAWSFEDFLRWLGVFAIGVVMVVAGWWLAAGQGRTDRQMVPASLAVAGLIVACAAHVVWVLKGRRAVGERMARLGAADWLAEDGAVAVTLPTELVVAAGASMLYHRPNCPMVRGREWPRSTAADQESEGRRACGVCSP
jgi:hypothetical protein